MQCADLLPASISAESRPPVDNCAYSSSSAGMRPARKKTTGSSSKSPSSASPVRDHAITPTLLCARRSAVRRAASSDLHATDGSARRRVPRAGAERLHDVDCFSSQVTELHSGRSAAAEFINGQARLAFRAVEIESPIGERTGTWIRHFDDAVLAFETLLCPSSSRSEHFKAKGDALPTRRTAFKSKHNAGSPREKRRAVADLRPTAPVART
jgi:hypothetical protein